MTGNTGQVGFPCVSTLAPTGSLGLTMTGSPVAPGTGAGMGSNTAVPRTSRR